MRPRAARFIITVTVLAVAAVTVGVVNSRFDGGFFAGLIIIVVPFVGLSVLLPLLIPVKCPACSGKMRFHFTPRMDSTDNEAKQMYGYVCEKCSATHLWEGSSSGSSFD
jgi:DNA-directed RNA polymerase subunit RPC12/RpoP